MVERLCCIIRLSVVLSESLGRVAAAYSCAGSIAPGIQVVRSYREEADPGPNQDNFMLRCGKAP